MAQNRIPNRIYHPRHDCYFIKESVYNDDIENLKSEIVAKDSDFKNLTSDMMAKEEWENLNGLAGKLYGEKDFVDVKIVCNEKTFDCHKVQT